MHLGSLRRPHPELGVGDAAAHRLRISSAKTWAICSGGG